MGVTLNREQIEALCSFMDLLVEWSGKINLIGISDRKRILNELLLDSLIPTPYLPDKGNLVDLGSGSGFPALIIKILKPDLNVRLIESNGKKVSFLKYTIHSLKLKGIDAINDRVEALTEKIKKWGCDIVTSRAMTDLENIIRLSDPFLGSRGIIVGFLGKEGVSELNKNKGLFLNHHLEIQKTITYLLPDKKAERTIVLLQKLTISDPSDY